MYTRIEQEFFNDFIGKNAENVKTMLEELFPNHTICLLEPNSVITADYRLDRIRITCDPNTYLVIDITNG